MKYRRVGNAYMTSEGEPCDKAWRAGKVDGKHYTAIVYPKGGGEDVPTRSLTQLPSIYAWGRGREHGPYEHGHHRMPPGKRVSKSGKVYYEYRVEKCCAPRVRRL